MGVPKFELYRLGWSDFQRLCQTVLSDVVGVQVEAYLDSNDAGRDGAFSGPWAGGAPGVRYVVQCKHVGRSDARLTPSGLTDELEKAGRLVEAGVCDVYFLVTNSRITGRSAKKIESMLRAKGVADVRIWTGDMLDRIIAERPRIRALVPRLYGLGDLTEILDERAYDQAQAVLEGMRSDLAKVVRTRTFDQAAAALAEHKFVLLLGAPATGKTTIASQLAIGAADQHGARVVVLQEPGDFDRLWNPNEPKQLFWIDDVFGATQANFDLIRAWARSTRKVKAAVDRGTRFILTSRDYVYRFARDYIKADALPVLHEGEVVVRVADISQSEREQILYNHLKHGQQPEAYVRRLLPHLEYAAAHEGFTPELARRLADPFFTKALDPSSRSSVGSYLGEPKVFLEDVIRGLDGPSRAALGLVFIHHDFLASPICLADADSDLVSRLGGSLGSVTSALDSMQDSLLRYRKLGGKPGWSFAHPTMIDAFSSFLRRPELIRHALAGFPMEVLLRETTCGDHEVEGAMVVPAGAYDVVLQRLAEHCARGFPERRAVDAYLSIRAGEAFLRLFVESHPRWLEGLARPVARTTILVRLFQLGLLPDGIRCAAVEYMTEWFLTELDDELLRSSGLRAMMENEEEQNLRARIIDELVPDLHDRANEHYAGFQSSGPDAEAAADEAETWAEAMRSLAVTLETEVLNAPGLGEAVAELEALVEDVLEANPPPKHDEYDDSWEHDSERGPVTRAPIRRSIFDDLLD